jgi:hypothetical protein
MSEKHHLCAHTQWVVEHDQTHGRKSTKGFDQIFFRHPQDRMGLRKAMNSQLVGQNTEAGILARLIQTRQDNLSRDAANYFLSLHFEDKDISRMNELSDLARLGTLAPADEAELDSYIHVSNLLAVMQSKARQSLRAMEA